MSADWPLVKLGEYCSKIGSGATPKGGSNVYLDKGEIFLIRSQNIYNNGFKPDGLVYITEDSADKLKNVTIEEDDILLNITGDSVARVCLAKAEYLPARVNQHVAIIRPKPAEFDTRFLRYFLASPKMQNLLLVIAGAGATRNALTKEMIESLEVPKPPLEVQTFIADNLSSLDDKIELNHQINQTLEAMAQAIFKSWFVDFEPVKAKIAATEAGEDTEGVTRAAMSAISGKTDEELDQLQVEQPEYYTQLKTTAELFPATMQDSDFGEIPDGWEVKKLSDLCTKVIDGTHDSPKPSEDGYYLVTGKNIVNGSIDFPKCYKISPEDHKKVIKRSKPEKGDIIFSNIGTLGSTVLVDQNFEFSIKNVALFKPLEGIYSRYLYLHFSSAQTQKLLIQKATGTTQIFFSLRFLRDLELITPPKYIISKFDEIAKLFFEERSLINQANQNLCDLRDSLLPKLLSGELSVGTSEFV